MDAACGFASSGQFINMIIISFTFEFMINSELQIYGTIWYFGLLTFIGFFFCIFFVKETRGLNDLEKKTLYSPKSSFEIEEEQVIEMQQAKGKQ